MKRKKLMALLMAGTMLMGSTVMADAASVSTNSVSDNTIGETITGTGDVNYIDTTVYEVVIPTSGSLGLTVDPQGLTGLQDGQTASASDLSAYAGKVFSDGVAIIANLGSKDVKVGVELALTGDATGVTTEAAVETGTANNILLYAVPAATSFYNSANDGTGYTASTKGIVMGSTARTVNFVIPAAEYEFKKTGSTVTYTRKADVTPSGTGIKFAGKVNTKADWADFEDGTSDIGMTAKFTFTHNVQSTDVPDSTTGAPAFMMAYDYDTVTVAADSTSGGSSNSGGSSSSQATAAIATLNSTGNKVLLSLNSSGGITDSSKLTDLKVKRGELEAVAVTCNVNTAGNATVKIDDMTAAGVVWKTGKTYVFTFKYNGVSYSATLVAP